MWSHNIFDNLFGIFDSPPPLPPPSPSPSPSPSYIYYDQTTLFKTPSPMHNLAHKRHILIESYFFAMGKGTSVGGVVFMSIIGAICFGLNTLPFL